MGGIQGLACADCVVLQADLAQKLLQQRALARSKEELGMPVRPKREARVPLQLSEVRTFPASCACSAISHTACKDGVYQVLSRFISCLILSA